ncbi:MAG: DUF533 domain-containing protein [Alcaligenaceae bacterium]|nr:DUF533 domain-containing protein [Alcaligenaceae bacterium]
MSAINILQSILGNISNKASGGSSSGGLGGLGDLGNLGNLAGNILGQIQDGFGRSDAAGSARDDSDILSKNDQMALGAGALAVLLGRRNNSNMAKLGGLAALGTVAFRAYQRWQAQQQGAVKVADAGPWFAATAEGQDITELDQESQEQSSRALIAAIILAARADGHVDEEEQAFIEHQTRSAATAEERDWINSLFKSAVDPREVSKYVDTPAIASQVYALSLAVINEPNFMERSYLDELARQLGITDALKVELERELQQQVA